MKKGLLQSRSRKAGVHKFPPKLSEGMSGGGKALRQGVGEEGLKFVEIVIQGRDRGRGESRAKRKEEEGDQPGGPLS